MLIETLRAVADALNDVTIGVNAQLSGIPLDAGDPALTPLTLITDETNNLSLAMNKAPNDSGYPLLLVTLAAPVEMKGEVMSDIRSSEVRVLVQYIAQGSTTQNVVRDAYYAMRGVQRCLHDFHSNDNQSMRYRNGIQIQECLSMTHQLVDTYESDNKIVTGMLVTYLVRDSQP